ESHVVEDGARPDARPERTQPERAQGREEGEPVGDHRQRHHAEAGGAPDPDLPDRLHRCRASSWRRNESSLPKYWTESRRPRTVDVLSDRRTSAPGISAMRRPRRSALTTTPVSQTPPGSR